jgi:hypothetical protein
MLRILRILAGGVCVLLVLAATAMAVTRLTMDRAREGAIRWERSAPVQIEHKCDRHDKTRCLRAGAARRQWGPRRVDDHTAKFKSVIPVKGPAAGSPVVNCPYLATESLDPHGSPTKLTVTSYTYKKRVCPDIATMHMDLARR